ncbi:CatB-related O-acetyltransferase [Vibrio splendidus]|uniref:CatB-related O-acetyltransferase n=1 Tax=Vibrio splendidus TaxID=29497 RepID=UPI00352D8264
MALIRTDCHPRAKCYENVSIIDSNIGCSSIGDNSNLVNMTIDDNVKIDRNNYLYHSSIGVYSYTGRNTTILHTQVGSFCSISWNVSIGGANHDYSRIAQHSFLYDDTSKIRHCSSGVEYDRFSDQLSIGSDVWIACGVVITRGVTIGDGAVVGANAVVTKDVPPYAIVAGNPAKVIKYRFSPEIIDILLTIKWWNWPIEKIKKNYELLSQQPSIDQLNKFIEGK